MDTYLTIDRAGEGLYKDKGSKFIAFARPARSADEALAIVADIRRQYHDARHCCYAYMLGSQRLEYRANDDGEPSGTAGRPILGRINSLGLTDVVVVVVRYFGGILLGTGGLIVAYGSAAADALGSAHVVERVVEQQFTIRFGYEQLSYVMRVVKELDATIVDQQMAESCSVTISIRLGAIDSLRAKLDGQKGIKMADA